jgi:hypothetical protein
MYKGIAVAGLGLAVAVAAGLAVSQATASHQGQGRVLWTSRYNGPGNLGDEASSVAVSPDGETVVVTGLSTGASGRKDYATIAYGAATGARLWVRRYGGPGGAEGVPSAVAISPSGDRVFVTGRAPDPAGGEHSFPSDYVTVAYDLTDGRQLWVSGHNGGPNYEVQRSDVLAVGPDGRTVFVSGPTNAGYLTIAYSAATGAQLWARIDKPRRGFGSFLAASALAISPDGRTVLAAWAGQAPPEAGVPALTTVAYHAATGARLWERSSQATTRSAGGIPAISVSPRGGMVFVSGTSSLGRVPGYEYLTIAYDIGSGAQKWARNYPAPSRGSGSASGLAVSPAGTMVYVTGSSSSVAGGARASACTTVAYRAATGAQAWVRRYSGGYPADPSFIAVGRSGRVYVTGSLGYAQYATVAYSADGVQLWARRYWGRGLEASARWLAVSPATGVVYVTGYIGTDYKRNFDFVTIAYRG